MSNHGHHTAKTYHGEPCAKCNGTLRYSSTRSCVACQAAATRARRALKATSTAFGDDLLGDVDARIEQERKIYHGVKT